MNDASGVTFARSGFSSYMILHQQAEPKPFEEEMLMNNEIPVLLTFFSRRPDGRRELWYDITSKKSFRYIMEQEQVSGKRLCAILLAVLEAFRVLDDFLISQNQIRMNQDTLYLSGNDTDMSVYLCFSPGEDNVLSEQFMRLYEYLMPIADREDPMVVPVIYDIYRYLSEGTFSLEELERRFRDILMGTGNPGEKDVLRNDQAYEKIGEEKTDVKLTDDYKTEEERRAIFKELFEDDEEPETVGEKINDFFRGLLNGIGGRMNKKKEELFPPRDLAEDMIYDPSTHIPAPTVLLSEDEDSCFGKLVYEGSGKEQDYVLDKDVNRVGGRDSRNDILLHSSAVSRFHARILKRGREFFVEDLNSSNGTFVNGEPVNVNVPRKLYYMDKISFADVDYRMV